MGFIPQAENVNQTHLSFMSSYKFSFINSKKKKKCVVLPDDFLELDDVRMVQLLQRLHLSQVHRLFPRVELLLHPAEQTHLIIFPVLRKTDRKDSADKKLLGDDRRHSGRWKFEDAACSTSGMEDVS